MTNEELYYLPASELLKHIQAKKERLIKEKIIKKSKPLSPITEEEKPYELPEGWEWVRLGEVVNCEDYKRIPISVKDRNFLEKKYRYYGSTGVIDYVDSFIFDGYYLLVGEDGADFIEKKKPVSFIATGQFWANNHVHILSSFFNNTITYLSYYLNTINYENIITGTAQKKLNQERLLNILIPLPPLYIQDQIVHKLEQLSDTKNSLLSHAESQLNYTKKMREALLQEAIRGELVPQDENDEPASVLLEKIKAEKERLIKEKVIKKQKELHPITEEEKPYELPEGWEWVRLGEIGAIIGGGTPKTNISEYWTDDEDGIPWLTPADLSGYNNMYISKGSRMITNLGLQKSSTQLLPKGSVIFSSRAPIGYTVIAENDICTNQGFKSTIPYLMNMNKYIYWVLKALVPMISENASGTTFKEISGSQLSIEIIPLPPLAEQERIATKLAELMANCDQLEAKAEKMKKYTTNLFEASLKEAFMPE